MTAGVDTRPQGLAGHERAVGDTRPRGRVAGWTVYLLSALIVSTLGWAAWAKIDVRVAGRGKLINTSQNIVLRPLEAGTLNALHVVPGQMLRQGDLIATLDPSFVAADVAQLAVRDLDLRAQVERLRRQAGDTAPPGEVLAQQADQQALLLDREAALVARLRQYDETIARLGAALTSNADDQRVAAARVQSLLDLEQMLEALARENFGTRARLLETRERRLDAERDLTLARGRATELARDIRVARAERESFRTDARRRIREELAQAVRESEEVREQLSKARRRADLVTLVAPQDAVVLEVRQTSIGSVLSPSEVFAVLVPLDEDLLAEVAIAPADVGEIAVGDRVRIKLDAYPFQKYGVLQGTLATVSADAFVVDTGGAAGARSTYRVRVQLHGTQLPRAQAPLRLLPGMTVTAEVIVGQRSVLSYFLYPLLRATDESIRER